LEQPPAQLLDYWQSAQGAIARESRQPIKHIAMQQLKSTTEQILEMQMWMQEQQMQARLMEQIESMEERKEQREERLERRQMMREQHGAFLQQHQPPTAFLTVQSYPSRSLQSDNPPSLSRRPKIPPAMPPPTQPRSSSPIEVNEEDGDTPIGFFDWRLGHKKRRTQREVGTCKECCHFQ
jgi:hypothetical protein